MSRKRKSGRTFAFCDEQRVASMDAQTFLSSILLRNGKKFVLRLEQNEGHLFLYNDETNKLIVELMPVSKTWIKKLQNYFKTGINDFSIEEE